MCFRAYLGLKKICQNCELRLSFKKKLIFLETGKVKILCCGELKALKKKMPNF